MAAAALVAHYARAFLLAALFSCACVVAGHALLVRVLKRSLPFEEHVSIACALGVFLFFAVSAVCGYAGVLGLPSFVLCPSILLAFGLRPALRSLNRVRRHLRRAHFRQRLCRLELAMLGFGALGIALLWLSILTPENASYDARWYHLPLAEEYVARGGITRFSEGWVHSAFPHLASLLYAWSFSLGGSVFDHVVGAAHLELAIFLMTLLGVVAVVRRCLGRRAPFSWVAVLLFPGIFCYDSGLVLGADHVAALWAAPIFLMLLRLRASKDLPSAILLGTLIAAALNTKYTASILLPLPLVFVAWGALARGARGYGKVAACLLATVIVLTAPHWLKNLIFYGDPLFPALRSWLPAHPWHSAESAPFQAMYALARPPPSVASVIEMLKTLVTFSFIPHDFFVYHGSVPVFGSLFTVLTPFGLAFRERVNLRWLFAGAYLGLVAWFWLHQFDRYLQALLPWMAAATATTIALVWREGGALRWVLALLVALQLAWGITIPFRFEHRAAGAPIYRVVLGLISSGKNADIAPSYAPWERIGRGLPRDARVLVHEEQVHVGLARATVCDVPGDQGAFYWGEPDAQTPLDVWRSLKAHGVSHVVWARQVDHGRASVAGSLVFFDFAARYLKPVTNVSIFAVAPLPDVAPPAEEPGAVAYLPCVGASPGAPELFPFAKLARMLESPARREQSGAQLTPADAVARARFLILDSACRGSTPPAPRAALELLARRGTMLLFTHI